MTEDSGHDESHHHNFGTKIAPPPCTKKPGSRPMWSVEEVYSRRPLLQNCDHKSQILGHSQYRQMTRSVATSVPGHIRHDERVDLRRSEAGGIDVVLRVRPRRLRRQFPQLVYRQGADAQGVVLIPRRQLQEMSGGKKRKTKNEGKKKNAALIRSRTAQPTRRQQK